MVPFVHINEEIRLQNKMELYEHLEMSRPFSLALFDRPELSRQESAVLSTTTQKDLYK